MEESRGARFGVRVPMEALEPDSARNVASTAGLIAARLRAA